MSNNFKTRYIRDRARLLEMVNREGTISAEVAAKILNRPRVVIEQMAGDLGTQIRYIQGNRVDPARLEKT